VHHWKVVIIGALSVALLVVSRKHSKALSKALQTQTEKYRAQMAELDKINNQANAEREKLLRNTSQTLKSLTTNSMLLLRHWTKKRKKKLKELLRRI
jgi:CRISPR/Cas system CMR subunit Cmr6 (Cas7 group RAMP superfamily)